MSEVDGANAEMTGKGRAQQLLVDDGLLLRHLRLRVLQVGGIGVERRLADRLHLELLLVTVVSDVAQLRHRLQRMQPRDIVGGAQLEKQRAFFDIVAGIERDRIRRRRKLPATNRRP